MLVVVGHRRAEIAAELAGSGAVLVENARYAEGMLSSVQVGVAAAPPETDWLVVVLGDQPWLQPGLVRQLLTQAEAESARSGGARILVPSRGGRRGHPLVLHATYREEVAALPGDGGLRELLRRHPEAICYVETPDDGALSDMDTPEEYRRALRQWGRGAEPEDPSGSAVPRRSSGSAD